MLLHGDEIGRTQQGNNNAYCQDDPTTWVHWEVDDEQRAFQRFVARALALRRRCSALRCARFSEIDLLPFDHEGREISHDGWSAIRAFGLRLAREGSPELLVLVNGLFDSVTFPRPQHLVPTRRVVALDTAAASRDDELLGAPWQVEPFSVLVLQSVEPRTT